MAAGNPFSFFQGGGSSIQIPSLNGPELWQTLFELDLQFMEPEPKNGPKNGGEAEKTNASCPLAIELPAFSRQQPDAARGSRPLTTLGVAHDSALLGFSVGSCGSVWTPHAHEAGSAGGWPTDEQHTTRFSMRHIIFVFQQCQQVLRSLAALANAHLCTDPYKMLLVRLSD